MQNLMPPVDTPDNLFHDGDPTQGIEGTIVEAEWMNNSQGATRDVQQEIINVLTAAGITPDPANQSQLLLALQQMISGDIDVALEGVLLAVNNLSEIAVGGESAQEQTRINIGCGTAATHDAEDFCHRITSLRQHLSPALTVKLAQLSWLQVMLMLSRKQNQMRAI